MSNKSIRKAVKIITGQPTTDGAGVQLVRVIGQQALMDLDPFLLLDAFRSDVPDDYIAGFPPHPHRGFETVTYLLDGNMRHKDNAGNEGVIEAGGIQWMTAGKGIIHSEMPEQENGLLEGFQLWINLPASHKMVEPQYQEHGAGDIPIESRDGTTIKIITGKTSQGTQGPVVQPLTRPLFFDITLDADTVFQESIETGHNAFVYIIDGSIEIEDEQNALQVLTRDRLAVLGEGEQIEIRSTADGARFLLVAGRPLNEPIARGGPFVMNTHSELKQAFSDYQTGSF